MKKAIGIVLGVILIGLAAVYLFVHEKRPEGHDPEAADALAEKMLNAVNDSAWQATGAVTWNFMGNHEHLWDRKRHLARVRWNDNEVFVDINARTGRAFRDGEPADGQKAEKLVQKAWEYWVNDAFWLNPVTKVFDDGTVREMATLKDGREGLMVTYTKGGNTPGDTYVWLLDDSYRPESWKMWVSIIPIGGIEVPWNGWIKTETGAWICATHDAAIDLKLTDIRTAASLEELTGGTDPFSVLF